MNNEEIIKAITDWANSSHGYISQNTDYGQGYSRGLSQAKAIVRHLLSKTGVTIA